MSWILLVVFTLIQYWHVDCFNSFTIRRSLVPEAIAATTTHHCTRRHTMKSTMRFPNSVPAQSRHLAPRQHIGTPVSSRISAIRGQRWISGTALAAAVLSCSAAHAEPAPARYQVSFERTWSSKTHPKDFPLLAHFSPVIGVTHNADYSPFKAGGTASPGVEHLCEEGKHQPLDDEIRSAIAAGAAGVLIETPDPIRDVPGKAVANFEINPSHPMVSIGAMIAPSPDWCGFAADVMLMENGQWVGKKSVTLYAWDTGTDSGTSYRAFDSDAEPRGTVQLSDAAYFLKKDGKRNPVGQVTFVRQ
ncbi:spondin domain-containing protein [Methylocaldum sp. RMAD-M]|uniref:spondin domain-containing protein n=1 Tax=Methylocaldum sp. RMAD-M TaxID=2806557 RepID=UPI000A325DC2|nr:spondin domain-containing protein [Methylocaldum sp. RMAD-M]MBP1152250.1 hypothetical protein [Methylocaldum sp. RMAD-M]